MSRLHRVLLILSLSLLSVGAHAQRRPVRSQAARPGGLKKASPVKLLTGLRGFEAVSYTHLTLPTKA